METGKTEGGTNPAGIGGCPAGRSDSWDGENWAFMKGHRLFVPAARRLRNGQPPIRGPSVRPSLLSIRE